MRPSGAPPCVEPDAVGGDGERRDRLVVEHLERGLGRRRPALRVGHRQQHLRGPQREQVHLRGGHRRRLADQPHEPAGDVPVVGDDALAAVAVRHAGAAAVERDSAAARHEIGPAGVRLGRQVGQLDEDRQGLHVELAVVVLDDERGLLQALARVRVGRDGPLGGRAVLEVPAVRDDLAVGVAVPGRARVERDLLAADRGARRMGERGERPVVVDAQPGRVLVRQPARVVDPQGDRVVR